MFRQFLILLSIVAVLSIPTAVPARAEAIGGRIEFHGFGSWAYGNTSVNEYLQGTPEGSYRDTALSLNFTADVSERLKIVGQVFWREDNFESETTIDYIFAEWKRSDALRFRIGQVKLPFGMSSEVFDVGTLRPFITLPQGVYGRVGLTAEAYRGLGLTGTAAIGRRWGISYDAYIGGQDLEEFEAPEAVLTGEPVSRETAFDTETSKDMFGGRVVFDTAVEGLRFGVSASTGTEVGNGHRDAIGGQVEYLSDVWSVRAEHVHESAHDHTRVDGSYLEAARRLGPHWQAALQVDRLHSKLLGVDDSIAPSLQHHEEAVVGINYWFGPEFVLKLSWHRVSGNRLATPDPDDLGAIVFAGSLEKRTSLIHFGGQFSF
jgi:hypothetical protein